MSITQSSIKVFLIAISIVNLFTGCSLDEFTSSHSQSSKQIDNLTTQNVIKRGYGIYSDAPVVGLNYKCGDITGYTDESGGFIYKIGDGCIFRIGALSIREVPGDKLKDERVFIQETDPKVAQLLLALDTNRSDNKIKIDTTISRELQNEKYRTHISQIDIKELLTALKGSLETKGIELNFGDLATVEEAKEHLQLSFIENSTQKGLITTKEENKAILSGDDRIKIALNSQGTIHSSSINPRVHTSARPTVEDKGRFSIDGDKDNSKYEDALYSYIPKGKDLTDAMAVKFLNMATFGANDKLVAELKEKGVVKWLESQLDRAYDEKKESILRRLITLCTTIDPDAYSYGNRNNISVDEWLADNNGLYFNKGRRHIIKELDFHYNVIFDYHLRDKSQLRQRVAYALSQIIVASQSNDQFFTERGEALSYYYDLLLKDAFSNYGKVLYDVSMSATMARYLTYANSAKKHKDFITGVEVLPDENYAREIMQLFSIGLFRLNMDGTIKRVDGKRVPTYNQEDVNNLSRVFTGLKYAHSRWGDTLLKADTTHPLECEMLYHDTDEKKILGEIISGGQNCSQDIRSAIDILMKHPNIAPFIAKKLILRLTKSNPKTDYVKRVAEVFAQTGGNLKETVKAVLLDSEIWEDIKLGRGVKFKEPYLELTQAIRAIGAKPLPVFSWPVYSKNSGKEFQDWTWKEIENPGFVTKSLYNVLGEYPTQSPTVFNFYSDNFEPDNFEFKIRGFVAPELEIITPKYAVAFNNFLYKLFTNTALSGRLTEVHKSPREFPGAYKADETYLYNYYGDIYSIFKKGGFGEELNKNLDNSGLKEDLIGSLVDYLSKKLVGKELSESKRRKLIERYRDTPIDITKTEKVYEREWILAKKLIVPIIVDIIHTDDYALQ